DSSRSGFRRRPDFVDGTLTRAGETLPDPEGSDRRADELRRNGRQPEPVLDPEREVNRERVEPHEGAQPRRDVPRALVEPGESQHQRNERKRDEKRELEGYRAHPILRAKLAVRRIDTGEKVEARNEEIRIHSGTKLDVPDGIALNELPGRAHRFFLDLVDRKRV